MLWLRDTEEACSQIRDAQPMTVEDFLLRNRVQGRSPGSSAVLGPRSRIVSVGSSYRPRLGRLPHYHLGCINSVVETATEGIEHDRSPDPYSAFVFRLPLEIVKILRSMSGHKSLLSVGHQVRDYVCAVCWINKTCSRQVVLARRKESNHVRLEAIARLLKKPYCQHLQNERPHRKTISNPPQFSQLDDILQFAVSYAVHVRLNIRF